MVCNSIPGNEGAVVIPEGAILEFSLSCFVDWELVMGQLKSDKSDSSPHEIAVELLILKSKRELSNGETRRTAV